jgi:hypothetical protein
VPYERVIPIRGHCLIGMFLMALGLAAVGCTGREPKAAVFRGEAWLDKKEYDKAIKDFDEAIRLDPKFAGAFYYRGIAGVPRRSTIRRSPSTTVARPGRRGTIRRSRITMRPFASTPRTPTLSI